jgi:hypothetical protein
MKRFLEAGGRITMDVRGPNGKDHKILLFEPKRREKEKPPPEQSKSP